MQAWHMLFSCEFCKTYTFFYITPPAASENILKRKLPFCTAIYLQEQSKITVSKLPGSRLSYDRGNELLCNLDKNVTPSITPRMMRSKQETIPRKILK